MEILKDLTVIIVTYKTPKKIILDCLKSINKNVNVFIIENSKNFVHEKIIKNKFSNVKIFCTGKNLGYANGNNFGLKLTKTSYALILNPDVTCEKDFFNNISDVINEAKDFSVIGCQYLHDKIFMPAGYFDREKNINFAKDFKMNYIAPLSKVEWVTGCSMILNLRKFNDNEIFDKNFFLFFEEFDLCKSITNNGHNIFSSNKLKIHHLGFQSSTNNYEIEENNILNLKDWHYMWSSFYFYKKNFGFFYAINKFYGKFFRSLFKVIFYTITFQKIKKDKYYYRFLGLLNSILGKPSHFRGK